MNLPASPYTQWNYSAYYNATTPYANGYPQQVTPVAYYANPTASNYGASYPTYYPAYPSHGAYPGYPSYQQPTYATYPTYPAYPSHPQSPYQTGYQPFWNYPVGK